MLCSSVSAYCENTTVHGFAYWVSAPRAAEKLAWVAVVIAGFAAGGSIVASAVRDWIVNPSVTTIDTFSKVPLSNFVHKLGQRQLVSFRSLFWKWIFLP